MERYANKNGDSPITYFQIEAERITVWFDDTPYSYTYRSAGKRNVERMKVLAKKGIGLSTYISQHVKSNYD